MDFQSYPPGVQGEISQSRRADKSSERPWTAVEKYRLRGLIGQRVPIRKIARTLRRPIGSVAAVAASLGLPPGT